MRRHHLPTRNAAAVSLGIIVASFGCADDEGTSDKPLDSGDPLGNSSGSPTLDPTAGSPSSSAPDQTVGEQPTSPQAPQPQAPQPQAPQAPQPQSPQPPSPQGSASQPDANAGGAGSADPTPGPGGSDPSGSGAGGSSPVAPGTGGSDPGSAGAPSSPTGTGGMAGNGNGEEFTGTCTESAGAGTNVSGSGPHDVVVETNSDDGIRCGTIFRPADLGGTEKYPIVVWGQGGCSQNGLSNRAAMGEIASWGYFVVADGTPGGSNACQGGQSGQAFLDYISWAIAENDKPCSAYYQSLETTKIAADGFSCGGLMAENVAGDRRFTAIGITSSGLMGRNDALWDSMHAPFKIMNGGSSDVAYQNGLNDYEAISSRGIPIVYFSKTSAGHGGDLNQGRGDFNLVNLAWLNWQLKGDEGATGKAFLHGPSCTFCNDSGWEYMSANID